MSSGEIPGVDAVSPKHGHDLPGTETSGRCARLPAWDEEADGGMASEEDCLALIDELFPASSPHVPQGRGDDCALLVDLPEAMLLSTDMFWEDVHFRTAYFTPQEAGGKALAAAVSDLAAAGALPLAFSLALMVPPWLCRSALRATLAGMAAKAREYGIFLSGGDLSRGERLGFSITVWGKSARPAGPLLKRGMARPGDCLFLVGEAGLAGTGLWALEQWGSQAAQDWPCACTAHLNPSPLLAEGRAIADLAYEARNTEHRLSLMDLSDGLARDLPRLLGSQGADLLFDKQKSIHPEIIRAAENMGKNAEELFLLGGEDYSLLGTCADFLWGRLAERLPEARLLGLVSARQGLRLHGVPLELEGFDHFSSQAAAGNSSAPASATTKSREDDEQNLFSKNTKAGAPASPGPEAASAVDPQTSSLRRVAGSMLPRGFLVAVEELVSIAREAWAGGLMAGFNGNLSCRVPLPPEWFPPADAASVAAGLQIREGCLITCSGAAKGRLRNDDFALLALDDGTLLAGNRPSTESAMHLAVYASCPASRAIIHTHPPFLSALSLLLPPETRLELPFPEAEAYRALLGQAPFHVPGSAELAQSTAETAREHAAVWMERHGLVVHAATLQRALALSEELEQLAKVHLALLQANAHLS